ncbi:hypothetical protein HZS55_04835 [Halosimplex rubrum]|uniref:Uncharacterized protein n=1 Tax=Halosimplex rubrum TaxID=869889 RepID=A0A7D5SYX6_9EURY|nr:hypothetical protein [Halosimplex rubrum]QLH76668.1 hypothetical protein HZS55_04835 [Halosimplex rubrum]
MTDNAFLDKGLVLGFCFPVDLHHRLCRQYLEDEAREFYLTEDIESIYAAKKREKIQAHRTAVLKHVRYIEQNYDSEMGPMDLQEVRRRLDRRSNDAWKYLKHYYEGKQFANPRDVVDDLREFARGMESHVSSRKDEFDELVEIWTREEDYPDLEESLRSIREDKEEDYWVCVDAHDLGERTSDETELATTDLDDLANGNRQKLIIENTSVDSVEAVAFTGS